MNCVLLLCCMRRKLLVSWRILPMYDLQINEIAVGSNGDDRLVGDWIHVLPDDAEAPYFLSSGWIHVWLQNLPTDCKVYLITQKGKQKYSGLFFLGKRIVNRSKLFKIKQLCLNISGDREYDNLWIEYNGFLGNGWQQEDLGVFLDSITIPWDELYLPGIDLSTFPGNSLSELRAPYRYVEDEAGISHYVDLNKVRLAKGDYLSLLSRNTRSQIRRSFRELEKFGSLDLEEASDLEHAWLIYAELVQLHQNVWQSRGEPGVFSSKLFCRFHDQLITARFDIGEVQLLRISAGKHTVGCLYNFVWQGKVYFYQCGFNYGFGKKVQPGLVSHVLAVQYNAEHGHDVYDFLAGEARYKKSLATDYNKMSWGRIQRKSLKLSLERLVCNLTERFRK